MGAGSSSLQIIAETGAVLVDFGPYVAALNDLGTVAFRAQRLDGSSGVFLAEGGALRALEVDGEMVGHPDLNNSGQVSFLTRTKEGVPAFWLASREGIATRAQCAGKFTDVGPRGPVMNDSGSAAFRAQLRPDCEAIFCAIRGRLHLVITSGEAFHAFPGLPVINRSGAVAFAVELESGDVMIFLRRGDTLTLVADTMSDFQQLGTFPSLNEAGQVAFSGVLKSGVAGAFLWTGDSRRSLTQTSSPFESIRSALLFGADGLILCATPRGGQLGIYRSDGTQAQRILGIGDAFEDSDIADFALNAVSVNSQGQFAVRVRLENGRQLILRAEPLAP